MAGALLLRTPDPLPGEGIFGYVLRVSETNGYDTPWHVFRHAGYGQGDIFTAGFSVQRLAEVLGKAPAQLKDHAYLDLAQDGQYQYRLNGQPIGRGLQSAPLRLKFPAICPACIKQNGFASACWDASAYVACPFHRSMLLQRCPTCDAGLTWLRPGLLKCRCGGSLTEAAAEPASAPTIALMRVLNSKLLDVPVLSDGEMDCGLPLEHLSAMSLNSMLRVIAILGKLNGDVTSENGAVEAAVEVFSEWPKGFHAYLRRMASKGVASGIQSIGLRKRFSKLFQALFKTQIEISGIEFIRDSFIAFGQNEWGLATVDSKLHRGEPQASRYVSAKAFAEAAGLMPITVKKWVKDGTLPGKVIELAMQNRYILDIEEAKAARRQNGDCIRMREAARIVELPVSTLIELKRSNMYSLNAAINRRPGFWAVDLCALSARILATSEKFPDGCPHGTVEGQKLISLGSILTAKQFGCDRAKGALVGELIEGKIRAVGRLDDSIGTIQFRLGDIDAFRLRIGLHANKSLITRGVAAAMLECTIAAVDGLIKTGHLLRVHSSQARICRDSVTRFQKQWTSARAKAKEVGTNSAWIASRAAVLGVPTLWVPDRDAKATFLAVDDVQRVLDDWANRSATKVEKARRPSPAEARDGAMKALRAYLAELQGRGASLPMCRGKPNRRAIARICGFSREIFYTNPEFLSLLDSDGPREWSTALASCTVHG